MRTVIALCVVGLVAASVASSPGARSRAGGAKTVQIPMPPVQTAQVSVLTVKVTASKGKTVTPPRIRTGNDSQLGNISLVYVVSGPTKRSASGTFNVYVLVKRFLQIRTLTATLPSSIDVTVDYPFDTGATYTLVRNSRPVSCEALGEIDGVFERGSSTSNALGFTWTLSTGRSRSAQPSPPEEVLDNIVESMVSQPGSRLPNCPWKPEGDDPGNT